MLLADMLLYHFKSHLCPDIDQKHSFLVCFSGFFIAFNAYRAMQCHNQQRFIRCSSSAPPLGGEMIQSGSRARAPLLSGPTKGDEGDGPFSKNVHQLEMREMPI